LWLWQFDELMNIQQWNKTHQMRQWLCLSLSSGSRHWSCNIHALHFSSWITDCVRRSLCRLHRRSVTFFIVSPDISSLNAGLHIIRVHFRPTAFWRKWSQTLELHFVSNRICLKKAEMVINAARLASQLKIVHSKSWCVNISSDVVLETRVLVSRRLEDKNETLGLRLGSWSLGLGLEHLVLVLVLQFFKTFVVNLDGSDQGTPWHFVRDNRSSLPFGSHCLREPSALHAHQPQLRGYLKMGAIC